MIKPKGDWVLVTIVEEEKRIGSIVLPDSSKDANIQKGIVEAVGPGKKEGTMMVSEGDIVIFPKYAGVVTLHEEKSYLLIKQTDILAMEETGDD